jgi:hypothetical protein
MNKSSKNLLRPLIAYDESAEGLQPRVTPLYDPSSLVPSHLSPVLMRCYCVVAPRWNNRLNPSLHKQRPHPIAVVPTVADQPLRLTSLAFARPHLNIVERRFDKFDFRRGSLLQVYSDRSTRAIGQYHKLCSLAAFSLPDQRTPFLARMNMPSMKHSSQRTFCWSESWSRKARQRCSKTSLSAHSVRRRWTALLEPYLSGSSLQGAPVHRIHKMPSKHLRSSSGGRPPFRERLRLGKCCFMSSHCLSVTARQAMDYLLDLVSYSTGFSCQPV